MLAIALYHKGGAADIALPIAADGTPDYNMVVPARLSKYFPHGMLGIGLTALMASFMSGMAGNVTAFNTVWTYDLYQRWFKPDASDAHLIKVGRATTVVGLLISAACAYAAAKCDFLVTLITILP